MGVLAQIPRHLLPQIPSDQIDEFRSFLKDHGVDSVDTTRPVEWFKPIQKHVNQKKVDNLVDNPDNITKSPLISTMDGYLVDGHHRWLSAKVLNMESMNSIVFNCPLDKFLNIAHDFDGTYVKSVHELTTYSRSMYDLLAEHKIKTYVRQQFRNLVM